MSQQVNVSKPGAPVTKTATQAAEHKGGLPQLNADDFAPQLVWLALTFGALYWIMARIALPRIADVLEKRRDHIASDIDAAHKFKQKSEEAEASYKASLADAKTKAHTIAQETRDELNAKTDAKRADVDSQINAKLIDAEKRIKTAKKSALKEINVIATTTTKDIVEHLIGNKTSDKDLANALKSIAAG
ncbi:MAG: F0F1 ATP synthase subunit B' [bacterium]|nr:F0F1 ATP synthase subunit B' [bacterium]